MQRAWQRVRQQLRRMREWKSWRLQAQEPRRTSQCTAFGLTGHLVQYVAAWHDSRSAAGSRGGGVERSKGGPDVGSDVGSGVSLQVAPLMFLTLVGENKFGGLASTTERKGRDTRRDPERWRGFGWSEWLRRGVRGDSVRGGTCAAVLSDRQGGSCETLIAGQEREGRGRRRRRRPHGSEGRVERAQGAWERRGRHATSGARAFRIARGFRIGRARSGEGGGDGGAVGLRLKSSLVTGHRRGSARVTAWRTSFCVTLLSTRFPTNRLFTPMEHK